MFLRAFKPDSVFVKRAMLVLDVKNVPKDSQDTRIVNHVLAMRPELSILAATLHVSARYNS